MRVGRLLFPGRLKCVHVDGRSAYVREHLQRPFREITAVITPEHLVEERLGLTIDDFRREEFPEERAEEVRPLENPTAGGDTGG